MKNVRRRTAGPSKSDRRREAIVDALRQCMLSKGYAETSLTDLARVSKMSVSHLLYYFPSREAVLEALCDEVVSSVERQVIVQSHSEPEERIRAIVDNVLIADTLSRSELGIVSELIALAVHRPAIRGRLRAYNRTMMAYLEAIFAQSPRQPGYTALDAAETAAALWMGLINNVAYDPRLDEARARRVLGRTMRFLALLPDPPPRAKRRRPKTA